MGLDGAELVMEVEDRFGITISDDEAVSIRTVGNVLVLINARIAAAQHVNCPSLGAFLQIRKLTRETLGQPFLRLRPSTSIASVVPVHRRHQLWRALTELYGTSPPLLRRPKLMRYALAAVSAIALLLGVLTATIDATILPLALLAAAAFIIMLQLATAPFPTEPPKTFATFGDASRRLVGLSMATQPMLTETEVLAAVRTLCGQILGVDADKVVPSARFVEDLGMC